MKWTHPHRSKKSSAGIAFYENANASFNLSVIDKALVATRIAQFNTTGIHVGPSVRVTAEVINVQDQFTIRSILSNQLAQLIFRAVAVGSTRFFEDNFLQNDRVLRIRYLSIWADNRLIYL